jgi:hypothetical protein
VSKGHDQWLAQRAAAARLLPQPTASRASAERLLWGGWRITVTGEQLIPLGGPGRVKVGGTKLEDARFSGSQITGRLRSLPETLEVSLDLGVARLEGIPVRVTRSPRVSLPDRVRSLVDRVHRLWR